jgi:UDP-glucose 4-epimerase
MYEQKIFKFIFSSSAAVYDSDQSVPFVETSKVGRTTSPYGTSKYIIEKILMDLAKSDKRWRIGIARYFNPIGNHFSGLIKDNSKAQENNLVSSIVKVAQKKDTVLKVFGKNYATRDGTCIRDYIHVSDLADAHTAMLKKNKLKKGLQIYNFGSGKGSTVLEVIKAFKKQTGIYIPIQFRKRRKGDISNSVCSPIKALKKLSWKATHNLDKSIMSLKSIL